MPAEPSTSQKAALFSERRLLLCVGPGGVGKTTNAAALALAAATSGRRVVVLTIDPARRLAQALGLGGDRTGEVVPVLRDGIHLDALVLDGEQVFDAIVQDCAASPESARRLLDSGIYRATARRLGGALEYAAMARVQMLYDAGEHDLIILDTPPTASAIDFLEAPKRIRELRENPAARLLSGTGKVGMKLLGLGGNVVMKALSSLGGGEFLRELSDFLQDFAEVLDAFQHRGGDFERLIRSRETGVLLVSSASSLSVREAGHFLEELVAYGLNIEAVILNRQDPPLPPPPEIATIREALRQRFDEGEVEALLPRLLEVYAGAKLRGEQGARSIEVLQHQPGGVPVWEILRRPQPPQTLEELQTLSEELFGGKTEDASAT